MATLLFQESRSTVDYSKIYEEYTSGFILLTVNIDSKSKKNLK